MFDKCPTCDSPAPHLHPAVQHEGEVQLCHDAFHRRVTPENTPKKIAEIQALLAGPYRRHPAAQNAEAGP